jgi:SAM-dependent methyltransferase
MAAQYFPAIFETPTIEQAKAIILTNEGPGADTDTRWSVETPYLLSLVLSAVAVGPDTVILDYGCGIGRMAKALIEATGCSVIGVDTSANMRVLATQYVASDRFVAISSGQFDILLRAGLRVHAALAIWVLQHCFAPATDIARIRGALTPGGRFCVLNMPRRAVPAVADAPADHARSFMWAADGIDVAALLRETFVVRNEMLPDMANLPGMSGAGTFWMCLERDEP